MKFNEKLQKLRKENKLSQEQLADMLDVSRQSVSKWESGQTYPEMDKLISMCKIFKCSLDDLTNDEITEVNIASKQKNNFSNLIDEMLDLISRTYSMFRKMNAKDISKFIIEMFLIIIILLLLKLPFNYIHRLGTEIFMNFGSTAGNILSGILNLLLTICYIILFIIIFVYIYKIRYLDKFDNYEKKEIDADSRNEEPINNENNTNKENKYIKTDEKKKKEHSFILFKVLGNIFMWFIKFIILCTGLPFIGALMFLCATFIVCIVLIFKGVFFFGIFIGLVSAILLNILILRLIFNFLFNKTIKLKNTFIILISSIIGLGISFGLTALDITSFSYVNKAPIETKKKVLVNEFNMKDDLIIQDEIYSGNFKYEVNNTLENKIQIEAHYYDDYSNISMMEFKNWIFVNSKEANEFSGNKIVNYIIEDLSKKRIHNYSKLYESDVTIYASQENIEKLKANWNEFDKERNEESDYYNRQIEQYETELSTKDDKIRELEEKNYTLEEEIEEYKIKIQEYKDNLNTILND